MKSSEIRSAFINYFKDKGHTEVPSSSLVPHDDPTLMFTNAGMNQFKHCFLGAEKRAYTRAVTCQKVMRIAGKHNDFENVGVTARHHTFFEMLGNFSFGDYFKADAIKYGWEFVTKILKIPESKLWVTIYEKDDEAGELWKSLTSVPASRIVRLGEADNFWSMGDTGPCGPCTEIHYFCGSDESTNTEASLRAGSSNFLEIWNLVFMQFDRDASGTLNPLPKPSVDTGMGLERVTAVLQQARSNYDTDLLRPIISVCEELSGHRYEGSRFDMPHQGADAQYIHDVAMRVIADHSRAMSLIIADGVLPGSEGRAYILRRIMRRAIRHGRNLGLHEPFLRVTAAKTIDILGECYPELHERKDVILRVVEAEERKFHETLDAGLSILSKEVERLPKGAPFPGAAAFLLHDTYGFPLDLTQDALKAHGRIVDIAGFESHMEQQRSRSREDRKNQNVTFAALKIDAAPTTFIGYDATESSATLLQWFPADQQEVFTLLFDRTPFYAESGGQVADTGSISVTAQGQTLSLEVLDVQKVQDRFFAHYCRGAGKPLTPSTLTTLVGKEFKLQVDVSRRNEIRAHHSATHLVHAALRKVLGTHVKQAGSKVDHESLRFDYSHFEPVTAEHLEQIQSLVNEEVRANAEVITRVMPVEEAMKGGAMALFGEKYGDMVRVVEIGPRSLELCGGTHVRRSGDIGFVSISHEASIAAGVRRIECVAGRAAHAALLAQQREEAALASLLKTKSGHITDKVERLQERVRTLEAELERAKAKIASSSAQDIAGSARKTTRGITLVTHTVEASDPGTLRSMVDSLRVKIGSGVVVLAGNTGDSSILVAGVTADLTSSVSAGALIKAAAESAGGKGGGRPDFAQAGGIPNDRVPTALNKIVELLS